MSDDIQKNNAAREFFSHFPYHRDVCDEILAELDKNEILKLLISEHYGNKNIQLLI